MKKITKFAFMAVSASMLFVSCQNDEMTSAGIAGSQQIEVNPVTGFDGTSPGVRSAIYGTTMPFDRNLIISAVYNKENKRGVEGPDVSKNYFQGVNFAYNASKKTWSSDDNPVYWPLTGSLDFLAYSTDDAQIEAGWNSTWSEGVTLSKFKSADFYSDDLLYGVSKESSPSTTAVPIEFKHAKALIVFTAKASFDEAIKIKKIELLTTKTAVGNTTVTLPYPDTDLSGVNSWNNLVEKASEELQGIDAGYTVPLTMIDVKKKSGYLGIGGEGIMLAPQAMTSIRVTFSQQYKGTGPSPVNGDEITETFTYDCKLGLATENQNWEAGKRYIYELDFRVNEINVVASVESWDDAFDENPNENKPYVIDIPEVANYTGTENMSVKVNLASGTKFIFDNGNGGVTVYTNNYPNAPVGTDNATANIILNQNAKFYVSEGGTVYVIISGNGNLFTGKVFDTDKFIVQYEVTLNSNSENHKFSGGNSTHSIYVGSGTNIIIDESEFILQLPELNNLVGWYKDQNCTNKWDFDKDVVTEPLTLYAKWVDTP